MTITNWISILAASIVALGWFVNGYLERRKAVSIRRLEYRLESLKSIIPVWKALKRNTANGNLDEFQANLDAAILNFQLYGRKDEIILMKRLAVALEKRDTQEANRTFDLILPLVQTRIRRELNIKDGID